MEIVDDEGNYVCSYAYDAWGNLLNIYGNKEIAKINPIRYRSYYYDEESGFYYLKTRYYDPELRRFISMDDICDVAYQMVDTNLYAYCCNDPVNLYDPEGRAYLYVDIFTIAEFEKETVDYLIDDIKEAWNGTTEYSYEVGDTMQAFIDWWNELDGTDIAIVNSHGSPESLEGITPIVQASFVSLIDELNKVDVELLVLLGCNAGHVNYWSTGGICRVLARKITGIVLASDGTVSYLTFPFPWDKYVSYTSIGDGEYRRWLPQNVNRDNWGWNLYSAAYARLAQTTKYTIDATTICNYYLKRDFITFK